MIEINYAQLNYLIERDGFLEIPDPRVGNWGSYNHKIFQAWQASMGDAGWRVTVRYPDDSDFRYLTVRRMTGQEWDSYVAARDAPPEQDLDESDRLGEGN